MQALDWINLILIVVLVLLLRKLLWCLRWLWCYHHGKELPEPISFLPQQSGRRFEEHVRRSGKECGEEEEETDEV